MKTLRLLAPMVALLLVASSAWAQKPTTTSAPTTAPAGKTPEILKQIPAGTIGYVVAPDLRKVFNVAERFLNDIDVMADIRNELPADGFLASIKEGLKLGEGFVPDKGVAAYILADKDFQQNVGKIFDDADKGTDKTLNSPLERWPIVFVVGAKDIETLFDDPDIKREADGKFTKMTKDKDTLYVFARDGYVLISTAAKYLTAVLEAKKTADSELDKEQLALLARSNAAAVLNIKAATPMLKSLVKYSEDKLNASTQPAGQTDTDTGDGTTAAPAFVSRQQTELQQIQQMMTLYMGAIDQLQSVTVGARVANDGVVFEGLVTVVPDSSMGKAMAAFKPDNKPLLGRLPNNAYMVAAASKIPPLEEMDGLPVGKDMAKKAREFAFETIKTAMQKAMDPFGTSTDAPEVPKAAMDKLAKICDDLQGEITGVQAAVTSTSDNVGLFGIDYVVECKDSAKVRAALEKAVDVANELIQGIGEKAGGLKDLTIEYKKAVAKEKASGTSVDAIEFTHPELNNIPQEAKTIIEKIIGEDKFRLLVAAPDKNTLLLTFGGSTGFLKDSLAAAKDGGTIPKEKGLAQAMEYMPKNLNQLVLFNGGNYFTTIVKAIGIASPVPFPIAITITTDVPIAIGVGFQDNHEHVVAYIPTLLVKETVGTIKNFMTQRMGGMGGGMMVPPPGEDD